MTSIPSLTPAEAFALARETSAIVLDVREPFELEICSVAGAIRIPLRELPMRVGELPTGRTVLCLCHHGVRSLRAAEWLHAHAFDVANISGGIERWAEDLDPSMPRY
jgi:rhodanese-related sulfurtransferase